MLGIVILNYNNNSDTLSCLKSLEKFTNKNSTKIYLIDNCSKSALSSDEVNLFTLNTKYTITDFNYGFAEGNNIGIRQAMKDRVDHIMLLNNDTEILDDSIDRVIDVLKNNPQYGIGGLVNYYHRSDTIWQAGFYNNFKTGKPIRIENFDTARPDVIEADYVPGSSLIVKKEVIEKIGLLDKNYFAYFEENDFCTKAKRNGYKTFFITNTKLYHKVGASSPSAVKLYLRVRNKLYFYKKHSKYIFFIKIFIIEYLKHFVKSFQTRNKELKMYMRIINLSYKDYLLKNMYLGNIKSVKK